MKGDFHYDTMPRQTGSQVLQQLQVRLREHGADSNSITSAMKRDSVGKDNSTIHSKIGKGGSSGKSSGVSFGKGFFKLISGKRSSSDSYLGDGFVSIS